MQAIKKMARSFKKQLTIYIAQHTHGKIFTLFGRVMDSQVIGENIAMCENVVRHIFGSFFLKERAA
jgi:hypothetical protein